MTRRQGIAFAALGLAALLVAWLALGTRQPPLLPDDPTHRVFEGTAACLSCHGADGPVPRSLDHPKGFECLRCHGAASARG